MSITLNIFLFALAMIGSVVVHEVLLRKTTVNLYERFKQAVIHFKLKPEDK